MTLFRSVLFWLILAVLGALLAQVLLQDPGYVLVRFRGTDYSTTVAVAVGLLLALILAVALLWTLLRLPFRAWRRHRARQRHPARHTDGELVHRCGRNLFRFRRFRGRRGDAARSPSRQNP